MPRAFSYEDRDTVLGTDYLYLFTETDDYRATFNGLIADLGLVQLVNGEIPVELLPDIIITGGGSGDFVGPSSATDGNFVVFDGPTGKRGKELAIANRLLPITGLSAGYILKTDGTSPSWISLMAAIGAGGTNGYFLKTDGTTASFADPLPAVGDEDQVMTVVGGVWAAADAPAAGSVTSAAIGAAIIAESNVVADLTPTTYILGVQGSTVVKINIGGAVTALNPNEDVTTDAFGAIQTTPYDEMRGAIGLDEGSNVAFASVTADTVTVGASEIAEVSTGQLSVEGTNVVMAGSSPTFGTATVTKLEVGNPDTSLERASAGKVTVESHPILAGDQSSALSAGFSQTAYTGIGTVTTGTVTPVITNGAVQSYTNNGAHTLAPPSATCSMMLEITNGASAGAITTSGFTKKDGDNFTTTNGHKFLCSIYKGSVGSWLTVKAMQ